MPKRFKITIVDAIEKKSDGKEEVDDPSREEEPSHDDDTPDQPSNPSTPQPVNRHPILQKIPDEVILACENGLAVKETFLNLSYSDVLRLMWCYPQYRPLFMQNGAPLVPLFDLFTYQVSVLEWAKEAISPKPKPVAPQLGVDHFDLNEMFGMRGGIISLEMGMGKTLTACVMALTLKTAKIQEKVPSLIICSKTLVTVWRDDIAKFFGGGVKVLLYHKDFIDEALFTRIATKDLAKYDLVVTTYDTCMGACKKGDFHEEALEYGDEHSLQAGKVIRVNLVNPDKVAKATKGPSIIFQTKWNHVFADESQKFANPKTFTYRAMMAIPSVYRWCLTGTMVRNYITDIWAQLRFLGYDGVREAPTWKRHGRAMFAAHKLERFIFEMGYADAGIKMPDKEIEIVHVPLNEKERELHDNILGVLKTLYNQSLMGLVKYSCVLEMFLRLRQCCIAPHLLVMGKSKDEEDVNEDHVGAREMFDEATGKYKKWINDGMGTAGVNASKISWAADLVRKISAQGEKVLVFSFFTSALTLVAQNLELVDPPLKKIRYHQIDGSVVGPTRQLLIERFKKKKRVTALLLSYKVGSEGLNLSNATHVIRMEPWWNSATHKQADARAWRTGQAKNVHVHEFLCQGTIEDRIAALCKEKELLEEEFKQAGKKKLKGGIDKYVMGELLGGM